MSGHIRGGGVEGTAAGDPTTLIETFFKEDPGPTLREGVARVKARAGGRCEANATDTCRGRHEHTHHKKGRRGPGVNHPDHLLAVCEPCHRWIHDHPAPSYALGFLERRTS